MDSKCSGVVIDISIAKQMTNQKHASNKTFITAFRMEEVLALQLRLASIQEAPQTRQVSARNVIEILEQLTPLFRFTLDLFSEWERVLDSSSSATRDI